MARDKEHKTGKARKEGKKYVCGECGAELEYGKTTCPTCQLNVDWTYLTGQVRRG